MAMIHQLFDEFAASVTSLQSSIGGKFASQDSAAVNSVDMLIEGNQVFMEMTVHREKEVVTYKSEYL